MEEERIRTLGRQLTSTRVVIQPLTKHQHTNAIVIKEMVIMTMSLDLQKTVFKRPQRLGEPQLGPQKKILKKGGVLPNSNYDPSPRSFY